MAKEILKNNNEVEITPSSNIRVKTKTLNSGFTNEKKVFSISGRVQLNKPTNIGTLKLSAAENKRFLKSPGINRVSSNRSISVNSYLSLSLDKVERDSNKNITAYFYNLIYTGKEKVAKLNKLKYKLSHDVTKIVSKALGISRVEFGPTKINKNGEKRKITVYGTPKAAFKLALNNILDYKDSTGTIVNSTETSALGANQRDETYNSLHVINQVIPSNGKYSFTQDFPEMNIVKSTLVQGNFSSGATKLIFDDLEGVEIGDEVLVNGQRSTVVTLDPDGDKWSSGTGYEINVFSTISPADNISAEFRRPNRYSLNILPTNTRGTFFTQTNYFDDPLTGWNGWYNKFLYQYKDPILILRATTTMLGLTIGPDSATQSSFSSSAPYDLIFHGKYDYVPDHSLSRNVNNNNDFILASRTITYVIKSTDHTGAFTLKTGAGEGSPTFSNTNQENSDWTNSVFDSNNGTRDSNGGTVIDISCNRKTNKGVLIDNSGDPNLCTITLNVTLDKWGKEDVIMALDIDNIITNS